VPFKEIKRKVNQVILNKRAHESFITIPSALLKHFPKYMKLLFDKEHNMIALQHSEDSCDYPSARRIWCTAFFQEYNISSQEIEVLWDEKRKMLIGRLRK